MNRIWNVQISPAVDQKRTPLNREDLPEEYDGQFYATWIAESEGEFHSNWIIWDIDNEEVEMSLEQCRAFVQKLISVVPRAAIRIVFSTRKGFHVYLDSRVVALEPSRTLHGHLRRFCLRLLPSSDASLYSPNHLLGLPNSVHRFTSLYYVPIPLENLFEWSIEQMKRHAESPQEFGARSEHCAPVIELCSVWKEEERKWKGVPALVDLMESYPPDHWAGWVRGGKQSNERLFKMCKDYKKKMISSQEAFVLITNVNMRIYPPFKPVELQTIVNSAYKNGK